MPKRKNRVREVLKELGLKHVQAAELCGINPERFRKIVGNRVEILGWELMYIARAFDTEERLLYEPDEIDVHTIQRDLPSDLLEAPSKAQLWRASLVADDEESASWLKQGLLQQEHLQESPEAAWIALEPGRILLGRAVEQLGTTIDKKESGMTIANQLLSIRRRGRDEDRKLSRFQLDISFCGAHEVLSVYVHSSAIKAEMQGAWHIATAGTCLLLCDQDRIRLPNEKTFRVTFEEDRDH